MSTEKYLRPEVIRQVARLDLRAKFIVQGFLSGLHASPFHGFSVEFSEHRKYVPGDDLKDLDWTVYAKTEKYYLKKYQAETNLTGYLVMDLSASMAYTYRQELTKFDYAICLAAALGYLMIHQQDPVGLVTFDTKIQTCLPPRSKRTHLNGILGALDAEQPPDRGAQHPLAQQRERGSRERERDQRQKSARESAVRLADAHRPQRGHGGENQAAETGHRPASDRPRRRLDQQALPQGHAGRCARRLERGTQCGDQRDDDAE